MKATHRAGYRNPHQGKRRLRWLLLVFFLGLALPVFMLLYKVYDQLENESYFRQHNSAEQLVDRIEQRLMEIITTEQQRPIAEYSFFNVLENPLLQSSTVKFSPLSVLPPQSSIPGLVGYFQIDSDGTFQIPALPDIDIDQTGLTGSELKNRIALRDKLHQLLAVSELPEEEAVSKLKDEDRRIGERENYRSQLQEKQESGRFDDFLQSAERDKYDALDRNEMETKAKKKRSSLDSKLQNDKFSAQKLQQLNIDASKWNEKNRLEEGYQLGQSSISSQSSYAARKELVKLPDQSLAGAVFNRARQQQAAAPTSQNHGSEISADFSQEQPAAQLRIVEQSPIAIISFESEVSPLQMVALNGDYFCFYRQAWSRDSRYIQGFIVAAGDFFKQTIKPLLTDVRGVPLSSMLIAFDGKLMQQYRSSTPASEILLFRRSLLPPFQQLEIIINTASLTEGSGKIVVDALAIALALILLLGFGGVYRLGMGQIELARQQRNFISAVSHELKTPLTSIRMYGEMLRSGWVNEEKRKKTYYDYIFFESERLSRLIANVLQLARLDNHTENAALMPYDPGVLLQNIKAKVNAQIEASTFCLHIISPDVDYTNAKVRVDEDALLQIMINLVDNAIKFSDTTAEKRIDIGLRITGRGKEAIFFVRDYGPGVDKKQMKKIFRLFYRAGDELTRTKPGTGIGLALVAQLADRLQAKIDILKREPGVEFQLKLALFA